MKWGRGLNPLPLQTTQALWSCTWVFFCNTPNVDLDDMRWSQVSNCLYQSEGVFWAFPRLAWDATCPPPTNTHCRMSKTPCSRQTGLHSSSRRAEDTAEVSGHSRCWRWLHARRETSGVPVGRTSSGTRLGEAGGRRIATVGHITPRSASYIRQPLRISMTVQRGNAACVN